MEIDPIFQGAGVKAGLEIWCIENLRLVPVPKSSYGKFFSGSAYIILNTVLLKSSSPQHDIHYWLGNDAKETFLKIDILVEGLSLETPIYVVTEGHEPPFFTRFFEWDSSKANMHGNSFERKLAILKGTAQKIEVPSRNSWKSYSMENIPHSLRSRSVSSNGLQRSVSSASSVSSSNLKSSDNHQISSVSPIAKSFFSGSYPDHDSAGNGTYP